jgi:hypothetical protein
MRIPITSESGWLTAEYTSNMIRFLGDRITARKSDLLAAACFRRIWHLVKTERGKNAVAILEQFADGNATDEELATARAAAWESTIEIPNPQGHRLPEHLALGAIALHDDLRDKLMTAAEATDWVKPGTPDAVSEPEAKSQCTLIRDIFGNPFRPVAFAPTWRTEAVVALARGMYESRDFAAMPVLADALDDAGCGGADILAHCRGPGPHVRGCWVVDLVLGKS